MNRATYSPKGALLASVLSLLLCVTLMAGTTFAWFTESITNTQNKILAGNLDVTLQYSKDLTSWTDVDSQTELFDTKLWEPGATEYVYFKISNAGTLALKYHFSVKVYSETPGTNVNGDTFLLSEVLRYGTVQNPSAGFADRASAVSAVENDSVQLFQGYTKSGSLVGKNGNDVDNDILAVVIYMPQNTNNSANYKTDTTAPTIQLGIQLDATQVENEKDGFGTDYDENAAFGATNANELTAALLAGGDVKLAGSIDGNTSVLPWGDAYPQFVSEYHANKVVTSISGGELIVNEGKTFGLVALGVPSIRDMAFTGNSSSVLYVDGDGENLPATTIQNVVINATGGAGIYGEWANEGVTLNNVTVIQNGYNTAYKPWFEAAVAAAQGSNITINSGYYKSSKYAVYAFGSEKNASTVTINGGTFIGELKAGGNDKIIVKGGMFSVDPSAFVDSNTHKVEQVGDFYVVAVKDAVIAESNTEIESALDQNVETITVTLAGDLTVDANAWATEAMGGDQTKTVVIDGNGYTLTFNQTNSDWNNIITANGATLVIKNAHLTNAGHNDGPWNRHDLNFACPVVLENVTSDKAIAVAADAKLTNVTITDDSGVYGLWVRANGQNVDIDGLTINAERAIKIADQYLSNPAKVTLKVSNSTFNTTKKAAILVTSPAGADITVSNVDISRVAADTVNHVWIDGENPEAPVTVTGGTVIQEP